MRYKFAEALENEMSKNENIFFITADLGYKIFDNIIKQYPTRAMTIGASEQLMLGMAVGLADSGKIPIVYSITPFLLYRPFEILRNYLDNEKCNVKLVGSGRDNDYSHDGFTHYAGDDRKILSTLHSIECFWPTDKEEISSIISNMVNTAKPQYLNLKR